MVTCSLHFLIVFLCVSDFSSCYTHFKIIAIIIFFKKTAFITFEVRNIFFRTILWLNRLPNATFTRECLRIYIQDIGFLFLIVNIFWLALLIEMNIYSKIGLCSSILGNRFNVDSSRWPFTNFVNFLRNQLADSTLLSC